MRGSSTPVVIDRCIGTKLKVVINMSIFFWHVITFLLICQNSILAGFTPMFANAYQLSFNICKNIGMLIVIFTLYQYIISSPIVVFKHLHCIVSIIAKGPLISLNWYDFPLCPKSPSLASTKKTTILFNLMNKL